MPSIYCPLVKFDLLLYVICLFNSFLIIILRGYSPEECPDVCIYPKGLPCPFTRQPWCPTMDDYEDPPCDTIYETRGYPQPFFPVTDPYFHIFTSAMNCTTDLPTSVETAETTEPPPTRPVVSAIPTVTPEPPVEYCPLIFKFWLVNSNTSNLAIY